MAPLPKEARLRIFHNGKVWQVRFEREDHAPSVADEAFIWFASTVCGDEHYSSRWSLDNRYRLTLKAQNIPQWQWLAGIFRAYRRSFASLLQERVPPRILSYDDGAHLERKETGKPLTSVIWEAEEIFFCLALVTQEIADNKPPYAAPIQQPAAWPLHSVFLEGDGPLHAALADFHDSYRALQSILKQFTEGHYDSDLSQPSDPTMLIPVVRETMDRCLVAFQVADDRLASMGQRDQSQVPNKPRQRKEPQTTKSTAPKTKTWGGRWQEVSGRAPLGEGGQGTVLLVTDGSGEVPGLCALKRIFKPRGIKRFATEVAALKKLAHRNIMPLLDHSALDAAGTSEKAFLVMPYAAGGTLEDRKSLYDGLVDATLLVARQLADALGYAHGHKVIHRDVKPANVLFRGNDHECLLSDFGICLIAEPDADRKTSLEEQVGPRWYMAPELEDGGQLEAAPAADVYSLGKVIYFMVSGGKCFPREKHREITYDIFGAGGPRMQAVGLLLDRMICVLESRIQTMAEVVEQIDHIDQDVGTARRPATADWRMQFVSPEALPRQHVAQSYPDDHGLREKLIHDGYEVAWVLTRDVPDRILHGGYDYVYVDNGKGEEQRILSDGQRDGWECILLKRRTS